MTENKSIYNTLSDLRQKKKKGIAVLIDPDTVKQTHFPALINSCEANEVDFVFVGGSLLVEDKTNWILEQFQGTSIPTILFPSTSMHIHHQADGFLLLSLLSGRNPDYLIGQHVLAAPFLKSSGMEIMSTSYLLIDSGAPTTATYISNTTPLPSNKPSIAASTALAGELLGHSLTFLDAGSGASQPVPAAIIRAVREQVSTPMIVGGGINTALKAFDAFQAGADLLVVGNAIEKEIDFLSTLSEVKQKYNQHSLLASL